MMFLLFWVLDFGGRINYFGVGTTMMWEEMVSSFL